MKMIFVSIIRIYVSSLWPPAAGSTAVQTQNQAEESLVR
jgi:hypothetical protein